MPGRALWVGMAAEKLLTLKTKTMRQETATIPYAYSSMILFKDLSEPKSKCLKSHADNARAKTPKNFISNVFIVLPSADSPHRSIKARQNKIPVNVFFITVCF